jgi:hypothetical protein
MSGIFVRAPIRSSLRFVSSLLLLLLQLRLLLLLLRQCCCYRRHRTDTSGAVDAGWVVGSFRLRRVHGAPNRARQRRRRRRRR